MTAAKKLANKGIDEKGLKKLIPLNTLSIDRLREIADKASVESLGATRTLFKFGDHDSKTYYLLSGEVEVQLPSGQNILVKADTPAALHPLSDIRPRQSTVVAKTNSTVLGIDRALLEILINDGRHAYEVNEINAEDRADWMTRFLQLLSVMNVPVKNIEQLIQNMEEYPVRAGEIVIRQSDRAADYYFVVKEGRCAVTKQAGADKSPIRVAELGEGTGFGEEALLAQQPRGATVTMLTDGYLMRLSKQDFNAFIAESALKFVNYDEARSLVDAGAVWLDVRNDADSRRNGFTGAVRLPLNSVRSKFRDLNAYGKYVACADTPQRAAAAAFVLRQLGYTVSVLNTGINSVLPAPATSGAAVESPAEVVSTNPQGNHENSRRLKTYGDSAVTGKESKRPDAGAPAADTAQPAIHDELDRAQREVQALRAQVEDARASEQNAAQHFLRSQDGATRELESAKEQSAQLQRRLAQLEQDRAGKSRELARLQEELELARVQARKDAEELARRAAEDAHQHVAEAQQEARIAQERANEFSLNLAATEAAHEATRNEIRLLQTELKRLRSDWTREQSELAAAKEAQAKEIARMKHDFDRELERKRAAEEALRSAESEAARLKAEVDAARKRAEEYSKRASETESMHANLLSEAKRKAEAAEALRREAEEQARRLSEAAEQSRKRAEDEARRVAEIEAARVRAIEESERRALLAEEIRRKADEEIARLKVESDNARRAEEARKKSQAAENARKQAEAQTQAREAAPTASQRLKAQQSEATGGDDVNELEQELARLQKKLESKKRSAISRRDDIERTNAAKNEPELQQNVYDISQKTQKLPTFKPNQGPPTNVGKVRKSGWVSDAILWETTLGLREDTEAESFLGEEQKAPPATSAPAAEAPPPRAEPSPRAMSSGELKTKPTFTARDFVPATGQRRVEIPSRKSNFGIIVAVAVAALAGGGIALVATDRSGPPKESVTPTATESANRNAPSPSNTGGASPRATDESIDRSTAKARVVEESGSGSIQRRPNAEKAERKAPATERSKPDAIPAPKAEAPKIEPRATSGGEPAASPAATEAVSAVPAAPAAATAPAQPANAAAGAAASTPPDAEKTARPVAVNPQYVAPPAPLGESKPAQTDGTKPVVPEFSDKGSVN